MALIETRDLGRIYDLDGGRVVALDRVSLDVEQGDLVAVMGPSGSGKSTFMNLIGCLDVPSAGQYWLNGHPVAGLSEDQLARIRNREIGFVFQSFNLLPRASALDNVAMPLVYAGVKKRERRERAAALLDKVGLGARKDHRPNELSGGQRQRVAIARALVTRPALLLADEPTGALDRRSGEQVRDLFQDLQTMGQTIILITHDAVLAASYASRIIKLVDGRVAEDSAVKEAA
jgi:putative ABC transport system ATP-binding protein